MDIFKIFKRRLTDVELSEEAEALWLVTVRKKRFNLHIQVSELTGQVQFYFFKYKFIYFNWRLITLQCCSGFAMHWHGSAMGVHLFPILSPRFLPPSPSHPSGSSQCTSPEHPISYIEPGLLIHFTYDNIHVSMPFSQIIPPSPSPTESKSVLYICVSFAVLYLGLWLPSF